MSLPINACLIKKALTDHPAFDELARRMEVNKKHGSMLFVGCTCGAKCEPTPDQLRALDDKLFDRMCNLPEAGPPFAGGEPNGPPKRAEKFSEFGAPFKIDEEVSAHDYNAGCAPYDKLRSPIKVTGIGRARCESGWMVDVRDVRGREWRLDSHWLRKVLRSTPVALPVQVAAQPGKPVRKHRAV